MGKVVRVGVLSIEGTNCDEELVTAFRRLGAAAEVVDLKQLSSGPNEPRYRRTLSEYQVVLFPGGFSGGDYVRAGAIMAARVRSHLQDELESFLATRGNILGGVCNGFQVLVELGLLPGRKEGVLLAPQAVLAPNASGRFECRPTYCRWEGGNFLPLQKVERGRVFQFPSAHGEGRLVLSGEKGATLRDLERGGQILFRWSDPEGRRAKYPWNPNGSEGDIAGITNPEGNVFGLMPHPERSFDRNQYPDWTRNPDGPREGDGRAFFEAIVRHCQGSTGR